MHDAAYDYVGRYASTRRLTVVEIGSRDVNFTIRPHFPHASYVGIDAQPGPCVDVVADGATWQPEEAVDLVVCAEVFEHTPNWQAIVENAAAMLRPGGRAVFTCAGPGRAEHGVHVDDPDLPGWYQNVAADDLAAAMGEAGLIDVEVETLGEDTRGTGVRP